MQARVSAFPTVTVGAGEREELFARSLSSVVDFEPFLRGWFLGAPVSEIRRGNLEQWLAWAFFGQPWAQVTPAGRIEIGRRVRAIEAHMGHTFAPGFNQAVRSMRVTLDPLQAYHKPLGYHALIAAIDVAYGLGLRAAGFVHLRSGRHGYWYRPARAPPVPSPTVAPPTPTVAPPTPIVFLHGIGVGLAPYGPFVHELAALGQPLVLVELPHISSRLVDDPPSQAQTVDDLAALLRRHGHASAHFVGHSMGTILTTWMIKQRPELVHSSVLIDPVCFMLNEAHVAYNFLYRPPSRMVEWVMHAFVGRDLHIVNVLMRSFDWCVGRWNVDVVGTRLLERGERVGKRTTPEFV